MRFVLAFCLAASPAAAETWVLRPVPLMDQAGFEAPMTAATLLAPDGWRGEGGISWRYEPCLQTLYGIDLRISSPDGRRSLGVPDLLPFKQLLVSGAAQPQPALPGVQACPDMSWSNLDDYVAALLPLWMPGARLLDRRARDDIRKQLEAEAEPIIAIARQQQMQGMTTDFGFDGAEFLIAAPGAQGEDRIDLVCGLSLTTQAMEVAPASSPGLPDIGGARIETRSGIPICAYQSAPNGQLDLRLTEAFRKSLSVNPDWQSRVAQAQRNVNEVRQREEGKRAAIIAEANAETSRIMAEINASRAASGDRQQRQFGELLRGVQSYHDPQTGGTVELDATFGNAYQTPDGGFVLTDDPNFDPAQLGAVQLQPVQ